ncbi:WD40 repeat domain-containing protein [Embleya sp. NPDC055664]
MLTGIFRNALSAVDPASLWQEQAYLDGHLAPLTAVDAATVGTPDSRPVVTGGYDGHVIGWAPDLRTVRWWCRLPDLVNAVALCPDGKRVAVAVADGYAYVLATTDGMILERLGPHRDDVNDVSWSPAHVGTLVTACDAGDPDVYVWRLGPDGPKAVRVSGHRHGVFAIGHARSGTAVATASEDGTVRVWRSDDAQTLAVLSHPGDVETVAWSPNDRWLATGCDDGILRLWSTETWRVARVLNDARAAVRRVGFSPAGGTVFGASYDGTIRLYEVASGNLRGECRGHLQWERACVMIDEETLLVGSFGGRLARREVSRRTDSTSPRREAPDDPPPPGTRGINTLVAGDDGEIVVGTDCGLVTRVGTAVAPLYRTTTLICAVRRNEVLGLVAVGDYLGRLAVSQAGEPAEVIASAPGGPLNAVEFLPDGTVVSGGYDGVLRRWSPNGIELDRVRAHKGPIKALAWCSAARVLVCGSADDTLSAWQVDYGWKEADRYADSDLTLVNSVSSPDERPWVATGSRDGAVRLWHPGTGERPLRLPTVHAKSVKTVAASADGRLVVSGSYDGTVCCWYLDETEALSGWRRLFLHGKPGVSCVAVTRDRIITAGWAGDIASWTREGRLIGHQVFVDTATVTR